MKMSLALLPLFIATLALPQTRQSSRYPVQQTETIQKSLAFSSASTPKKVEIDNINGSLKVTGYDGRTVEMTAVKTIRADSQDRMEAAKREVRLEFTENADTVSIYVDEPGRCNCRDGSSGRSNARSRRNPGYRVEIDFEVRVPRDVELFLRTVNNGDIEASNIAGIFDIDNVNGDVELNGISGSGRAYALNGELKVTFAGNPQADSYFGSLNGDITATFRPGFNANLLFKTFNGEVYTDFPLTSLPPVVQSTERRNGKLLYSKHDFSRFRVGRGGPEIRFDGFNGDIRVLGGAG